MLNVLRADFYKLRKSKAFWICTLVGIVVAVLMVVAVQAGISRSLARADTSSPEYQQMLAMSKSVSGTWAITEFLPQGNFILILAGVFVAIFISAEFGYGTMKNTLSRGAERVSVFASKYITCAVGALFMLVMFIAALLVSGTIVWGFGSVAAGGFVVMVLLQMLLMLAFTAVFVFISMTVRSSGGAIATNIISVMIVSTLLQALSMLFGSNTDLSQYWLTGAISTLATYTPASGDVIRGVIVALAWGIVTSAAGLVLFRKTDVK